MKEKIKILYHRDPDDIKYEKISKINLGDWIDLRANGYYSFSSGGFDLIDLGVSMELPHGYEAIIAARSSLFVRHGLIVANGIGIIDNSYNGDNDVWKLPVYATRDTFIDDCERIAQFRIIKNQPEITLFEVGTLGNADRGGFGRTGRF